MARTHAFAALVFAELLRAFGCRSEAKPVWRIPLFSNPNLALVVVLSFSLQIWSFHSPNLGRFLKTSLVSIPETLLLLALSSVPLVVLELAKVMRLRWSRRPRSVVNR